MILLKETKRIDLQKPSANEESPPHEIYDPLLNRVEMIDSSAAQEERNTMRLLLYSSLIVVIRLRIILSGIHYLHWNLSALRPLSPVLVLQH